MQRVTLQLALQLALLWVCRSAPLDDWAKRHEASAGFFCEACIAALDLLLLLLLFGKGPQGPGRGGGGRKGSKKAALSPWGGGGESQGPPEREKFKAKRERERGEANEGIEGRCIWLCPSLRVVQVQVQVQVQVRR